METKLDLFGLLVVRSIRDGGFDYLERLLAGQWKAPSETAIQRELAGLEEDGKDLVRRACRKSIEYALHKFLTSLEEACAREQLEVTIEGESVTSLSDGLGGELFSDAGWYARFSKYGPKE